MSSDKNIGIDAGGDIKENLRSSISEATVTGNSGKATQIDINSYVEEMANCSETPTNADSSSASEDESDDDSDAAQRLLASLELSADTMKALQEFMQEQREREEKLEEIKQGKIPEEFEENWNLSQFWYEQETANLMAVECLRVAKAAAAARPDGSKRQGSIACISSPTLYRAIAKMNHDCKVKLLEFDTRFAVFGDDFVLYDYRNPLAVPVDLRDEFDVVLADPPYLEEDCLTKMSVTIKFVTNPDSKVVLCTGKIMEDLADRLMNLKLQQFEIKHEKERLSNPFGCFANYSFDEHCKYEN